MPTSYIRRRNYLRAVGGSVATIAVSGTVVSATESETVTLTGKLESSTGDPIAGRKVYNSGYTDTDSSGRFEMSVESNSRVRLGLYKSGNQLLAPIKNGVPHIDGLGRHSVGSSDTDIGTISVSEAYLVNLRAIDNEGNPVTDAEFHVRADGYGSGSHMMTANESGYLVIRNADFTGIELAESAKVTITIPGNDGEADKQYQETIYVDGPKTVIAREGEGVTIKDHKPTESTTTTTTQTTTETTTSTTASETTTTETTSTTTKISASTTSPTSSQTTEMAMSANKTETQSKRGFLSNGESAGDYEFLTNPFHLTVGGFVLSVAGIAHNLLWGR